MASLAKQVLDKVNGTVVTWATCDPAGDVFPNDGVGLCSFRNTSLVDITVTFAAQGTCDFGLSNSRLHDRSVVVSALTAHVVGLLPQAQFNDNMGNVSISYSPAPTGMFVAFVSPQP